MPRTVWRHTELHPLLLVTAQSLVFFDACFNSSRLCLPFIVVPNVDKRFSSVQFSSVPYRFGSSRGHERQFTRNTLPVFFLCRGSLWAVLAWAGTSTFTKRIVDENKTRKGCGCVWGGGGRQLERSIPDTGLTAVWVFDMQVSYYLPFNLDKISLYCFQRLPRLILNR